MCNSTDAVDGSIVGAAGLVKAGPGTLSLGGSSSYAGGTTVGAGVLKVNSNTAMGAGNVTLGGGVLQLAGAPISIGVKFATAAWNAAYNVTGTAGAGVVAAGNWNNEIGAQQSAPQSLHDSTNASTSAVVAWYDPSNTPYSTFSNQADQNKQLLNAYLDNRTRNAETVTVSDIPYSTYSVYVYFASNVNGRKGSVTIGGTTHDYSTCASTTTLPYPYVQTTSTSPSNYQNANYAVFTGLTGSSFTLSQYTVGGNSGVAAVQVVGSAGFALTNNLQLTADSTIDVTGCNGGAMGNLTSTQSYTLQVTGGSIGPNTPYTLALGSVNVDGNPTFNVANNGTGTGMLALGALGDGGVARTITKSNTGTLTLAAPAASLADGTRINVAGGTLNAQSANAMGSLAALAVANGATLSLGANQTIGSLGDGGTPVANSASVVLNGKTLTAGGANNLSSTFSGVISDGTLAGRLTKAGSGTLTLAGASTYSGTTTIVAGRLVVIGSLGSSTIGIQSGGVLENDGTLAGTTTVGSGALAQGIGLYGPVTLQSGGTFSPGNGIGQATSGPATWYGGGRYQLDLGNASGSAGIGWDLWNVAGSLSLAGTAGGRYTIDLDSLSGSAAGPAANFDNSKSYEWQIANVTGQVNGFNPAEFSVDASGFANALGGGTFAVSETGSSLYLDFEPDPPLELGSLALPSMARPMSMSAVMAPSIHISATPEPSTLVLLAVAAIVGLAARLRRRKAER